MLDDQLPPLPLFEPTAEWDGRVRLPARWVETGEFGEIRIPYEDCGRWEKPQVVDGHWYRWNGFFFESAGNAQPAILYPDGSRGVSNVEGWRPGSPPLRSIHDRYGNVYDYDQHQDAYVYRRTPSAYRPPREHRPTDGANAGDTSVPGILLAVFGHWLRGWDAGRGQVELAVQDRVLDAFGVGLVCNLPPVLSRAVQTIYIAAFK